MGKLDDLFTYETQKVVRIHDSRLGLTYIGFVVAILCYVVGFQIFLSNEHFERRDVSGTARMTIQQPTNRCNPNDPDCTSDYHSFTELPYCQNYAGNASLATQRKCVFADQHTLMPFGMLKGDMLVPTRIDKMYETNTCNPTAENGFTCKNEYTVKAGEDIIYVADIERYTVMISHTFKRRHLKGNNRQIEGSYLVCEVDESEPQFLRDAKLTVKGQRECNGKYVKKQIECITGSCGFAKDKASLLEQGTHAQARPGSFRQQQASLVAEEQTGKQNLGTNPAELAAGGVFAIPDGDIFSIAKLLELSGLDLDKTINADGEPLREAGTVIEITAIYNNLHAFASSFGYTGIDYTYKVSQRPMEEMKTELFAQHQPDFPHERIIENRHGLYIVVTIAGEFGFFSIVYLLIMLTTAVGLIGVAVAITDKLALYAMDGQDLACGDYKNAKYDIFRADDAEEDGALKAKDK